MKDNSNHVQLLHTKLYVAEEANLYVKPMQIQWNHSEHFEHFTQFLAIL